MSKGKLILANRVYNIMNKYCHDDVVDNNATVSDVLICILDDPLKVIEALTEIIERKEVN